jgi:hypothetical protein
MKALTTGSTGDTGKPKDGRKIISVHLSHQKCTPHFDLLFPVLPVSPVVKNFFTKGTA